MKDELHDRLDEVERKISEMRGKLKERDSWHDSHHLTTGEMAARYSFLKAQLDDEVAYLELHSHLVTRLEVSLRLWLEGIDA